MLHFLCAQGNAYEQDHRCHGLRVVVWLLRSKLISAINLPICCVWAGDFG